MDTATKYTAKQDLIEALREIAKIGDQEAAHVMADELLLLFINDPEVTAAYEAIEKWFA